MGPRWKGKGSEAKALAEPMSKIVQQLQSSLIQSQTHGSLSGCSVLIEAEPEQAHLLNMACFGRPIVTAEKDKQWYQLGFEEAFYLCHSLKCLQIVGVEDNCAKKEEELWKYMNSKRTEFPYFYKAYSHLRMKNWAVRPGSQYGVDFVAYRHHPALVHSEYAVILLSEGGDNVNRRLRVWSDLEGTIRLCGSVAKTLLVLTISSNGFDSVFPLCLKQYSVEERTCTRWNPEQNREDHLVIKNVVNETQ
ncbi:tRNA-splicing endonuclease subunit Sen2-1-like [Telopea speciosissima]|uniref:tRNA-splicing endonuclease subunit Sen2-1-like n=1 Tax=Telopea speciosissima TaxID=54955 RepID=UPI001CC3C74C|nr:tRNA-splicing endonuclease subunit Sen2-1-like [Telopea speciosissima]